MGIPSYFSYIIKNYSNIIRSCKQIVDEQVCFQYLYMDCNSIIYDEFRQMENLHLLISMSSICCLKSNALSFVISCLGLGESTKRRSANQLDNGYHDGTAWATG